MGKASSSKKIRRVQQAGVSRAPGQRRNLGYPALIGGIVVVGLVMVFLARGQRQASAEVKPTPRDHWHQAFGIDVCGKFEAAVNDSGPDRKGVHTHGDGLIHVHPFGQGASGKNARLGLFFEQIGLTVTDTSVTLPGGKTWTNGNKCDGKAAELALYVWPPQANANTEAERVTKDIADVRFTEDGGAYVLAFVPKGAKVSLPPSMDELASPSDLETTPTPGDTTGVAPTTAPATTAPATPAPDSTAPASTAPASTPSTTAGG